MGSEMCIRDRVEVISSRGRNGIDLENDLRWGVYVTFEAPSEYVERCFADYGLTTDASGKYSALWRPYHLIGLELGITVATAGCPKGNCSAAACCGTSCRPHTASIPRTRSSIGSGAGA